MNRRDQRVISIRVKLELLGAIEEAAHQRHLPVSTFAANVLAEWCVANGLLKREGNRAARS